MCRTAVENPIVVMKRYEVKFVLNREQTRFVEERIKGHLEEDEFGLTSIASLYYDTPDYRLIRTSMEKPNFKEKIRLRSYGPATKESPVFLELKRKADGIVYKRRVQTTIPLADKFMDGKGDICYGGQINREISYFRDYYGTLSPSCLIIYDRIAYYEPDGDVRLTIDRNPRYRMQDLRLDKDMEGISLLPDGYSIMEVKVQGTFPFWFLQILGEGKIYKSSFSKYGAAYMRHSEEIQGERITG